MKRGFPPDFGVWIGFIVMFLSGLWFGWDLISRFIHEAANRNDLKHSFFDIINIEEKLHFTWRMTELRNVSLKIFLHLIR
jgi:hypothetical protein